MFDVIVIGARCAGSPTAMLLARQGYRVLLVDRATFPSDTTSTHFTWQTLGAARARARHKLSGIFPRDELPAVRASLERHLLDGSSLVGDFAEPFRHGARVERIRAMGDLPNFFRKPYGDGWALVGDAGHHKDPILAQGISDAFRSAELVADAVHAGFSGARPLDVAMAEYQHVRDEHFAPMYDLTCGMAGLEPPPPEMLALYQALRHNSVERDRYFGTLGGTVRIPEFYAPENVQRIINAASA